MFVLKDEIKAWWPVEVKEPDTKVAGRFITYKFEVEFRLIDRDEGKAHNDQRAAILKKAEDLDLTEAERERILEELIAFDDDSYLEVISDWRGVIAEDKSEVPFSSSVLMKALKRPHIRAAIDLAYAEFQGGEGRRKN
jgi:predicted house-cleaning noncanonical NTP pyrophosphatase (MazG superfamily)